VTKAFVPNVGLSDGREIPQLGFGVHLIPAPETAQVVSHALAAGYRHIDTAAAYLNEAEVGKAIRSSGLGRDEVVVATKLFNDDHGYDEARRACDASVERLDIGAIDLYLIHWPVPMHDRYVETWRALIDLQSEGLVRSIGVSNFQTDHIERLIDETGVAPVLNQIELHPRFQQSALRRRHNELGVVTEAWFPLAQGQVLSDPVLVDIAKHQDRSPAQVVIRWHLQLGNVVIPKSVTPARIEENLDVFNFELSPEQMAAISTLDMAERLGPHPDTHITWIPGQ